MLHWKKLVLKTRSIGSPRLLKNPRFVVIVLGLSLFQSLSLCAANTQVDERLVSVVQGAAHALGEDVEFRLLRNDALKMKAFRETLSLMLMSLSQDSSTVELISKEAPFDLSQNPESVGLSLMNQAKQAGNTKWQVFLEACSRAQDTFSLSAFPRDTRSLRAIFAGDLQIQSLSDQDTILENLANSVMNGDPSASQNGLEDLANSVLGNLN